MGLLFYIYLVSLIPLAAMAISDFKRRAIDTWWLVLFTILIFAAAISKYGIGESLSNALVNLSLSAFMLLFATLYWHIRYGKWQNPVNNSIGLGDVVFMAVLCPFFGLRTFLIFLLVSMSLCLVVWYAVKLKTGRDNSIPLVGGMGIVLALDFIKEITGL